MSITLLCLLLFAVLVYWLATQILPERRRTSLLRPGLGEGLLGTLNDRRHGRGLPMLELDEELTRTAENKAVHQLLTGRDEEGWEYPQAYAPLFGRSLVLEALFTGPMPSMVDRMIRLRDIFDAEWVRCGIGAAGDRSGEGVVALILCREAWEPAAEVTQPRFVLGDLGEVS